MTTITELRRLMGEALDGARHRGKRKMLTGRRTGTGSDDVTLAAAEMNKVWVRSADASRELTQAWGYAGAVNIWVWVETDPSGELHILGPVFAESTATAGAALGAVTSPPLIGEAAPVAIASRQFLPGLVYPTGTGLVVSVFEFSHRLGTSGTPTLDLASSLPALPGQVHWVVIALDPTTNTLQASEGSAITGGVDDLAEADAHAVDPAAGHIPLRAVALEYGQTSITAGSRWIERRRWLDADTAGYQTIEDEGTPLTQRETLNFVGSGVSVADSGGKTVVTIAGGSGHTIEDEGTPLTQRDTLNFVGSGVSVADSGGKTVVTIAGGSGHTIEDEGTPLTQRDTLNFVGSGVSVADSGGKTVVTIAGASSTSQILFTAGGNLAVAASPFRFYNQLGVNKTISKVFLSVGTAPTGSAVIVDVHKNGTTIFTNQANRPQIAAGQSTGQTSTIDVAAWNAGDYLEMAIDAVGSTTPGSNLAVHVVYE